MPNSTADLKTLSYDYRLPPDLIATHPANPRENARLLVYKRAEKSISDLRVKDLPDVLPPNSLLIANNTKVIPARILAQKPTGGYFELLLHRKNPNGTWNCKILNSRKLKPKNPYPIFDGEAVLEILAKREDHTFDVSVKSKRPFGELLNEYASAPLPPYLLKQRPGGENNRERDLADYQTVYAKSEGSVAAPTAGLHFTQTLIENLSKKGFEMLFITLHVGLGTFEPVKADSLTEHRMHSENYEIEEDTAEKINRAKKEGRKIVAVGTTTLRCLESSCKNGQCKASQNGTDIFIFPGHRFEMADGLITNFHLPQSSLLMLVSAFCGRENILKLYRHAIEKEYRFYSFGDANLYL